MSQNERQRELLIVLCQRRFDTCTNLAQEFHVCRKTICRDIAALTRFYPIETVRGHGGGVKVSNDFYLHRNILTEQQVAALMEMKKTAVGEMLDVINSILAQFTP